MAKSRDLSNYGTAALLNTGTGGGDLPTNDDLGLGTAATRDVGTDPTQIPTNADLPAASLPTTGGAFAAAAYMKEVDVSATYSNPQRVLFKNNGTVAFLADTTTTSIYQFDVPNIPYDIADVDWTNPVNSYDYSTTSVNYRYFEIADDGLTMWIYSNSNVIHQYQIGSAFDLSTVTYGGQNFSVTAVASPRAFQFIDNGNRCIFLDNTGVELEDYALSTAFDITTLNSPNTRPIPTTSTNVGGMVVSPDGARLLISFSSSTPNDTVEEFAFNNFTAGTIQGKTTNTLFLTPYTSDGFSSPSYSADGNYLYFTSAGDDKIFQFNTSLPNRQAL